MTERKRPVVGERDDREESLEKGCFQGRKVSPSVVLKNRGSSTVLVEAVVIRQSVFPKPFVTPLHDFVTRPSHALCLP